MRNHCLKLLFIFWIGGVFGLRSDLIRQDGQKGPEVVEAVVDVIRDNSIFTTDRLFLRRLAVIQSTDGTDPKTYRHGYHGGIWQINETQFDLVHNCPGQLSSICNSINTSLLIDWRSTNWKDLRKPLYSGLAATLVTIYKYNKTIPGDLQTQARIWQQVFAPDQNFIKFTSMYKSKGGADVVCHREGIERECSRVDFQLSKYNKYLCKDIWDTIKNPCDPNADLTKASNIFHPVDSDANKYIKCDLKGNMYLTRCPGGEQYNHQSYSCGTESLVSEMYKIAHLFAQNPCTTNTDHGVRFHAHPTDKSKYIECDSSDRAWLLSCPQNQLWIQDEQICRKNPCHDKWLLADHCNLLQDVVSNIKKFVKTITNFRPV